MSDDTGRALQVGAPLLSGNVPSQISLSGQNYIELCLPTAAFTASAPSTAKDVSKP